MAESGASGVDPVDGGTLLPPNAPADLHSAMASLAAAGCGGSADTNALMDTSHVQQLINHGADVNASDNNGWTPLHTAAYHGQEEIVRILLAANSDVNARNKSEETPLHLAAKWPQDRVVEALLAGGADLSARNKRGRTPAHVAALFNRHAILDRLLNAGADVNAADADHATPLHLAVRQGSPVEPELVKTLIRHKADLEARDVKGNAPLHFLPYAQEWLHWAAYEGQEALVRVLLGKPGVRPDAVGEEGVTPLHLAAHANSVSMVTLLLEAGAKVNATSQPPSRQSGKDSSYLAGLPGVPSSITSGVSISSSLRVYGAAKLPPGELTALHVAAERGSAELIRVLVAAGAKVNVQGERGMAPLHVAVWDGNTAAVASLLAAKASVALKSKAGGFTAVHCACLSARATPELLALLLDNGGAAVIEERCQEGWTALHLACQSAPPAMVELLLQRGARPSAKGKNGKTAADCAAKRPEILQVLHVATGGKVPLPVGLALPAAAAAAGLLTNGAGGKAGSGTGQLTAGRGSGKTSSGGRGGPGGRQLSGGSSSMPGAGPSTGSAAASSASASGPGSAASPSTSTAIMTTSASAAGSSAASSAAAAGSSSSSSALLPGTAAVLEPLESVEATLAALLADMGGALCSLQAGAIFGSGACTVDPVGHCIRPLDKRLVMVCTMGCQFAFHLPCWKAARELLKERWPGFTGALQAGGQYACIAPGCSGYVREQAICDGAHGQTSNPSRLYWMPREQYDELPSTAKPIGGGPPPLPGGGEGCLGVGGSVQQPAQPAIPAGLTPSLSLAQAMVQAATALGNVVGGRSGLAGSPLAVALAAGGGLQQLLGAASPPVPAVMSAREAAAIAAQTMGACLGGGGGGGGGSSSCVVEELSEEDEEDEIVFMYGGENGSGGGARAGGSAAGVGSGKAATSSSASGAPAVVAASNGPSSKRHGGSGSGSGSGGSSAPPVAKKGGKVASKGSKGSSAISSAAAAEMLQQLQGLQQAVAAVQNAVGAGVSSAGDGAGAGPGGCGGGAGTGSSSGTAVAAVDQGSAAAAGGAAPSAGDTSASAAAGSAGSKAPAPSPPPPAPVAELPPPPAAVLPPPPTPLLPADGAAADSSGDGGYSLQEPAAPVPPPRRRSTPPHIARQPPPPLSESGRLGQPPVSPQLATPPPATSLHTPGVQPRLSPKRGSAGGSAARQPDALLTPILVGPVETPAAAAASPAAAPAQSEAVSTATSAIPATTAEKQEQKQVLEPPAEEGSPPARPASPPGKATAGPGKAGAFGSPVAAAVGNSKAGVQQPHADAPQGPVPELVRDLDSPTAPAAAAAAPVDSAAAVEAPAAMAAAPPLVASSSSHAPAGPVTEAAAAAAAAAGAAGKALASVAAAPSGGLTVTRAVMVSPKLSAAQAAVAFGTTPSYEPGQYARMVCPDLQPGQHRVTRSAGSGSAQGPDGGSEAGAPATSAATARPYGATATQAASVGCGTPAARSYDVVLNALRGLVAGDGTAAAAAGSPTAAGSVVDGGSGGTGDSGTPAASRHLLLESGDIPLLAGTPGMLEAWLSAHVGSHGKLASYRILAPCGAVAVTLECEAAAEAAAEALRARDKLLVQPLAVGPLRAFPEDDVLAATVQKVAKSRSPAGDTTWMNDMVQLWQQLQGLPPTVHNAGP